MCEGLVVYGRRVMPLRSSGPWQEEGPRPWSIRLDQTLRCCPSSSQSSPGTGGVRRAASCGPSGLRELPHAPPTRALGVEVTRRTALCAPSSVHPCAVLRPRRQQMSWWGWQRGRRPSPPRASCSPESGSPRLGNSSASA